MANLGNIRTKLDEQYPIPLRAFRFQHEDSVASWLIPDKEFRLH